MLIDCRAHPCFDKTLKMAFLRGVALCIAISAQQVQANSSCLDEVKAEIEISEGKCALQHTWWTFHRAAPRRSLAQAQTDFDPSCQHAPSCCNLISSKYFFLTFSIYMHCIPQMVSNSAMTLSSPLGSRVQPRRARPLQPASGVLVERPHWTVVLRLILTLHQNCVNLLLKSLSLVRP